MGKRNEKTGGRMKFRRATLDDCGLLAELNHQLIRDEGHRNRLSVAELGQRMRGWLASEYTAILFEDGGGTVAHGLYQEQVAGTFLPHLFVTANLRLQGAVRG